MSPISATYSHGHIGSALGSVRLSRTPSSWVRVSPISSISASWISAAPGWLVQVVAAGYDGNDSTDAHGRPGGGRPRPREVIHARAEDPGPKNPTRSPTGNPTPLSGAAESRARSERSPAEGHAGLAA